MRQWYRLSHSRDSRVFSLTLRSKDIHFLPVNCSTFNIQEMIRHENETGFLTLKYKSLNWKFLSKKKFIKKRINKTFEVLVWNWNKNELKRHLKLTVQYSFKDS